MTQSPIHLPLHNTATRAAWYRLSLTLALISAVFCLTVAAILVVNFVRDRAESPLVVPVPSQTASTQPAAAHTPRAIAELQNLQWALAAHPEEEPLKTRIRQIDLLLRQQHFERRARILQGGYLLLGGLIVLVLALKISTQFGVTQPGAMTAFPPMADPWKQASAARRGIALAAGVLIAALAYFALTPAPSFPVTTTAKAPPSTGPATAPHPTEAFPTGDQLMQNWPSFRGYQGSGVAATPSPPVHWDGPAGHNILWKVPIPLVGASSPIVWEDRIFLTGGSSTKQEVYCFNAVTGALLWQRAVTGPVPGASLNLAEDTGYAPNTMATDGHRAYAIFPTGDVAAFDFAGQQLWAQNLGKPENAYGHASSLATWKDRLIIQFDQGSDPADGRSALIALDGPTGKPVWKTKRAVANSWASPIVIYPDSGPQIITAARPLVAAYDPADGHEIWSANVLDGDVAPSPVYAAGTVIAVMEGAALNAIRINGHGDVTKSHLAWSGTEGLPDIVSPLATADIVLLVHSGGLVTCFDAHNGKQLWQHDFELKFHASPALAGNKIYLIDRTGDTHLLEAGPAFKELAILPLGEAVSASPAFIRDRIYIRAKTNLYCIGGP